MLQLVFWLIGLASSVQQQNVSQVFTKDILEDTCTKNLFWNILDRRWSRYCKLRL